MGGEDDIIDFESLKQTLVFWNIDDYPIPVDAAADDELDAMLGDISKALGLMGFPEEFKDVRLYSEQLNYDKSKLCDAEVTSYYLPKDKSKSSAKRCKVPAMTLYMIRYATIIGPGPVNIWVIAKPKRELDRVLQCLKSRRHNVLIVKPPPPQPDEEFLFTLDFLLENTRFLGGGKPRFKPILDHYALEYHESYERYVVTKEDTSKTVDFSERIPVVKGERTAVFWDAVDCPFPLSSTPDDIYRSIKSAMVAKGFCKKNMTIWAYLDDDDDKYGSSWRKDVLLGDKTWASRIYFLPAGDKASRRIRMINDIALWVRDSRRYTSTFEASLVLFADGFKDDAYYAHMLQILNMFRFYFIFVTPTPDINKPDSPEWPALLLDKGASWFDDETGAVSKEQMHDAEQEDMDYTSESSDDVDPEEAEEEEMQTDRRDVCPLASLVEEGPAWENDAVEEVSPDDPPRYRWNHAIQMYTLKSLFPRKKHQHHDQAAQEEEEEEETTPCTELT